MAYALNVIGTDSNTNNKYIEVWKTFSGLSEKLSRSEGAPLQQLEQVAEQAAFFLRSP
jgi:hypothetical protein